MSDLVYESLEAITGVPKDELAEIAEENLFENDILDSLSLAELVSSLEKATGKKINLKDMNFECFSTINQIIAFANR